MRRFLFTSDAIDIFYVYFIEITVQMNNYITSEGDCFWTLDTISFTQKFNKLDIKYQSYIKSTKIVAFEQKICASVTILIMTIVIILLLINLCGPLHIPMLHFIV